MASADRRHLLKLLAKSGGRRGALLLAHGFPPQLITELIAAGLATAESQSVVHAGRAPVDGD